MLTIRSKAPIIRMLSGPVQTCEKPERGNGFSLGISSNRNVSRRKSATLDGMSNGE